MSKQDLTRKQFDILTCLERQHKAITQRELAEATKMSLGSVNRTVNALQAMGLIDGGVSLTFLMKLGLEYRFITQYLTGEIPDKDEMLSLLATAIKQFAKRQMIWFRRDKDIQWLDMTADPFAEAKAKIDAFLADYKASVNAVKDVEATAKLCANFGIIAAEPIAKKAIPRCNVVFVAGADMRPTIDGYYQILFDKHFLY